MKKILFFLFPICLLCSPVKGQLVLSEHFDCVVEGSDDTSVRALTATEFHSKYGINVSPKGTLRVLAIFVSIIYDLTPGASTVTNEWWPDSNVEGVNLHSLETYFRQGFDPEDIKPYTGYYTRYFAESSFDSLIVIGDFMSVDIKQSTVTPQVQTFTVNQLANSVINLINLHGGLQTFYGHDSIQDYDKYTLNYSSGQPKAAVADGKIDYIAFFFKNATDNYGQAVWGKGWASHGSTSPTIKIGSNYYPYSAISYNGVGWSNLFYDGNMFRHEFTHSLLGNNSFHTSGGTTYNTSFENTFFGKQYGYGLWGGMSCNGYERWRLNWQHPANAAYPIAVNNVNSDIDKTMGAKTFYLRDFLSSGDAVRVKLPYKDSPAASNQYIWIENHQIGRNNKLERKPYSNFPGVEHCFPQGTPGIYMYYQVGKDIIESTNFNIVYPPDEQDNLKIISAEPKCNKIYIDNRVDCPINWGQRPYLIDTSENSLMGHSDLSGTYICPPSGNITSTSFEKVVGIKSRNNVLHDNLPYQMSTKDAFTDNTSISISTNPAAVNTTTFYCIKDNNGYLLKVSTSPNRNTSNIYLSGLNISMNESGTDAFGRIFKVDIRWDDYDVKNNVNWAGSIILKEQLNLLSNKTITLEQNLTPSQMDRDPVSGLFSPPTKFTCESGSVFIMNPNSTTILKDKSSLIMSNGSNLTVQAGAQIVVESGSTMIVKQGANLTIQGNGKLFIQPGGYLCVESGANIQLQDYNSIISMQPGAVYGANPALFSSNSCLSSIAFTGNGCIPDYSQDVYIQNETISTNRYIGGKNIYIGNNVTTTKPQGNVLITNNAKVIFDGQIVKFDTGFKCDLGATFEVIKK